MHVIIVRWKERENHIRCRLWKYSTSIQVFILIIELVYQCLQMSSLCIHGVSLQCQMNLLHWKYLFQKKESKEWKKRRGEFLPDPAPLCDCCCWAARLDVTWGGCGGTQKQWGKRSRDREDGIKEGGINVGGKRKRQDWEKWNKKNWVVAIPIKTLLAQWVQWNLWGVMNEHRGIVMKSPRKTEVWFKQMQYIKSSELLWLSLHSIIWQIIHIDTLLNHLLKKKKDYLTVNILTPKYEFVTI